MAKITKEDALRYHAEGKPGKIEVIPTKPHSSQTDLSLAYSPGVAEPCLEIKNNPHDAYEYTAKGNLVAVISNGTAVLGLGDIGPLAGKPVMEGKGLLFKIFAGIDVFDIEVDEKDPAKFVEAVKKLQKEGMRDLIIDLQGNGGYFVGIAANNLISHKSQKIAYQPSRTFVLHGGYTFSFTTS